jgi:hypothetical protein
MATRVYLGTLGAGVLFEDNGGSLAAWAGESATVKVMSTGANATHYSARTGGSSSTAAITTSATGALERWVDPGEYTITVGSDTYDFHAVPGSVRVPVVLPLFGPHPVEAMAAEGLSSASYNWVGAALSASAFEFYASMNCRVVYAVWRVVWTPGDASCGIRLVKFDAGPTNIEVIDELTGLTGGPRNDGELVTSAMQDVIDEISGNPVGGTHKQIGYQTKGDGASTGPLIYLSQVSMLVEA